MKCFSLLLCLIGFEMTAQRVRQSENTGHTQHNSTQHEVHDGESHDSHSHLEHILDYRKETAYVPNLPPAQLLQSIGKVDFKITTQSNKTQEFFNQSYSRSKNNKHSSSIRFLNRTNQSTKHY